MHGCPDGSGLAGSSALIIPVNQGDKQDCIAEKAHSAGRGHGSESGQCGALVLPGTEGAIPGGGTGGNFEGQAGRAGIPRPVRRGDSEFLGGTL